MMDLGPYVFPECGLEFSLGFDLNNDGRNHDSNADKNNNYRSRTSRSRIQEWDLIEFDTIYNYIDRRIMV